MNGFVGGALTVLGVMAAAELGGSMYLYQRTMRRQKKGSTERTIKMAGTDCLLRNGKKFFCPSR